MSLADDFGDTGGDWTAEWRRIHLDLADMNRLQIDTQLRVLKTMTLKLDKEETAKGLMDLQYHLVKLERDAQRYARKAEELRAAVATFIAAVHAYRSTWTPPAETSEWSVQINGLDEEAIDRIARFYRDSGRDIR